jgi:hypothetical protein
VKHAKPEDAATFHEFIFSRQRAIVRAMQDGILLRHRIYDKHKCIRDPQSQAKNAFWELQFIKPFCAIILRQTSVHIPCGKQRMQALD